MTFEKRFPCWATAERYRFVKELTYGEFLEELRHRSALIGTTEKPVIVKNIILETALRGITTGRSAKLGFGAVEHRADIATQETHADYISAKALREYAPEAIPGPDKRSGKRAITEMANRGVLMFLDLFIAKRCGVIDVTDEVIARIVSESSGIDEGFKEMKRRGRLAIDHEYLDSLRNKLFEKKLFYVAANFKWPQTLK